MKVIEDENARVVTFSKRRSSLFKKATEISVLCGAQVALLIFSIGGRGHSFGHPSIASVMDRFFNRNPVGNAQSSTSGAPADAGTLKRLKDECDQSGAELEAKKRRSKELEAALENLPVQLSEEHIGTLDINQLKHLKQVLETLCVNLRSVAEQPQMASVDPPPDAMEIDEASSSQKVGLDAVDNGGSNPSQTPLDPVWSKKVDLASVDKDAGDASPIPAGWLSL